MNDDGAPGRPATPYGRIGGAPAVTELADAFYGRVLADPALLPLFADPTEDHAGRMALFLAELLGGPAQHTAQRGGPNTMFQVHRGLPITEVQRQKWVDHMIAAIDGLELPSDLRAGLLAYVERGSRLARATSRQPVP